MRRVGEKVLVSTRSGRYDAVPGVVALAAPGGALVKLEGERRARLFLDREIRSVDAVTTVVGAE